MTHDELKEKLSNAYHTPLYLALRAVVELHKPVLHSKHKYICEGCNLFYPCDTIQAIEKELK